MSITTLTFWRLQSQSVTGMALQCVFNVLIKGMSHRGPLFVLFALLTVNI